MKERKEKKRKEKNNHRESKNKNVEPKYKRARNSAHNARIKTHHQREHNTKNANTPCLALTFPFTTPGPAPKFENNGRNTEL